MEVLIQNLHKRYGKVHALNGINLHIQTGMFGLLGPNGAGKTTLMRILATLLPKSSGSVRIGPYDLATEPHKVREILGYLPQSFNTYRNFTAAQVLDYVAVLKGITDKKERVRAVDQVLEQVNLSRRSRERVGTFSGGMKQRVGIAQALIGNPKLLIVDEPTTVVYDGTPDALVARARGRVWSLTVRPGEEASLHGSKILARRQTADGVQIRCIAKNPPAPGAKLAVPTLEDAYMTVVDDRPEVAS